MTAQVLGDCEEVGRRARSSRGGGDRMDDGDVRRGDRVAPTSLARGISRRGHAEVEHRAGEMFGGVDLAVDAEDLLRAGDADVIGELAAEMPEAGAIAGAGEQRHPGAARAAVEVDAEIGRKPARSAAELRRQDFVDVRIAFEDGAEAIFDDDGEAQVGAEAFQDVERGGGENAIAERPEPRQRPPGCPAADMRERFPRRPYSSIFASSTSMTGISSRIG